MPTPAQGTREAPRDRTESDHLATIFVSYYTGQPDMVPHEPRECQQAAGWELTYEERHEVTLLGPDGNPVDVPLAVLGFDPPGGSGGSRRTVLFFFLPLLLFEFSIAPRNVCCRLICCTLNHPARTIFNTRHQSWGSSVAAWGERNSSSDTLPSEEP